MRRGQNESWEDYCLRVEDHYPEVKEHMETWGPHCGAPVEVYRGHLVKLVIALGRRAVTSSDNP